MIKQNKGFRKGVYFSKTQDPVLRSYIWVVLGESMKDCGEFLKEVTGEIENPIAEGAVAQCSERFFETTTHKQHHVFILLHNLAHPSTMAHEVIHAKNYICKWRGIKPDTDNDEFEAYYTDYLMDLVITAQFKYHNKNKKTKNGKRKK